MPVAVRGCPVRTGRRGAHGARAGRVAAVPEPGAGVPARPRRSTRPLARAGSMRGAAAGTCWSRPATPGWPLAFAIDASTYPRPGAELQPGSRVPPSFLPGQPRRRRGGDRGVVVPSRLARLSFAHDSWTAPQDQVRAGAVRDDPTRQAAAQVIAHSSRLRAAGEDRVPLYVLHARLRRGPADLGPAPAPGQGAGAGPAAQRPGAVPRPAAPRPGHDGAPPRPTDPATDRFECK